MDLRNGDCLEILKDIPDKTVDLVFADLPYGCTNCRWDCKVDLELLWKELLRVARGPNTPFFFTVTTKFGYELIKSNEKMFKFDLVWAKSNCCGFLQAKKQPMRKHEMLYVFYKKQPAYDISSHKHKFKKDEKTEMVKDNSCNLVYGNNTNYGKKHYTSKERSSNVYDPPLPVSVIKEEEKTEVVKYDVEYKKDLYGVKRDDRENKKIYDPPLPVSVIKEDKGCYSEKVPNSEAKYGQKCSKQYDPPLPTSVLDIKSIRLKQHSTAKPPDLMKWILKYYTKEGDTVLDPTMGSNAMGLACKEMNRNFIGIEKDKDIYDFACSRVS